MAVRSFSYVVHTYLLNPFQRINSIFIRVNSYEPSSTCVNERNSILLPLSVRSLVKLTRQ